VTTPDRHLEELRRLALATDIKPVSDPGDLARLSIRSLHERLGDVLPPDRPEIDVRLHGPGIPGHEIPVREAAGILTALQETIASIGQVLTHQPTAHGRIHLAVLNATELRLTPEMSMGSVIFHLAGVGEEVSGDEAAELTGSDTLVDIALGQFFMLLERSDAARIETTELAEELRRFGPRTAKHLSDLVERVMKDEIDMDLTWRAPHGHRRHTALERGAALAISDAIKRNKVETTTVELTGVLVTVSMVMKAELLTEDHGRLKLSVEPEQAASLGPFFDKRVTVSAEQTIKWSTSTGQEKRTFRLLDLRQA
jgi:hypothetical protein